VTGPDGSRWDNDDALFVYPYECDLGSELEIDIPANGRYEIAVRDYRWRAGRVDVQLVRADTSPEVCFALYEPVCGTDSVTYNNTCEADLAGVEVEYDGECCVVAGCSGQLCVTQSDPNVFSTCEYLEEYICFAGATCERQASGTCGWTDTQELRDCLETPL
jgi:hypothetical protein